MALSDEQIKSSMRKLLLSRMRILNNHGFYGLLLMHMKFSIDEESPTAWTDGERICFGVNFLEQLTEKEVDFVLMHEILHVVLKHNVRGKKFRDQHERYNIACDIVINSTILKENQMDLSSITVGYGKEPSMHLAPDSKEGYNYTAEQVFYMLPEMKEKSGKGNGIPGEKNGPNGSGGTFSGGFKDDHSKWGQSENDSFEQAKWEQHIKTAAEAFRRRAALQNHGSIPGSVERMLLEMKRPQTDWRTLLLDFVQEEVNDYSFYPPDNRYDGPFFLPDFNDKEESVSNILFMVDTSASMTDEMVTHAFSEIRGAIDQFGGKLCGYLGFFDAQVTEPKSFSDVNSFELIKPKGGGGTSFEAIFQYVKENMSDSLPASIVILSDGYAPFPNEECTLGIPVLWLLNNDTVNPPWGKVARIQLDKY